MKSRKRHQRRSRWAHVNSQQGLRNRKAKADAKREAMCATLPPAYVPPGPGEHWQRITVDLYVPTCPARCDQHAVMIDGRIVGLVGATDLGRAVAAAARKRPSHAELAEIRRDEWREALRSPLDSLV